MKRRMALWLAGLMLIAGAVPALGEGASSPETADATVTIEERGLTLGDCRVAYPTVAGMEDQALQDAVNQQIMADTGITEYVTRMSLLISGGRLEAGWQGGIYGDVLSCGVYAEGAVTTPRSDYVWTAANIDLRDGREIAMEELFTDPDAAKAKMEEILEWDIAPDLSAHLQSAELTPLPEVFRMDTRGITFMYPKDRFCTLSDRAGDILIHWNDIAEWLDPSEDGIPARAGALRALTLNEDSAAGLAAAAEAGAFPDIPLKLGDSVKETVDRRKLLIDPDICESGRLFSLEGGALRGVFLMTDKLTEEWDNSVITGIRVDAGCLFGLRIGETLREDYLSVLGEADTTLTVDGEKAELWRRAPGRRDYYEFGDRTLMLDTDENGVLISVILT